MNINVRINERPWPRDKIFMNLSLLHPATIETTAEGYLHLLVDFGGKEVIFMESSEDPEGNKHFLVVKELGQLRPLLSFNLAETGPIPLRESDGFSSSWPEWTLLLVASDFDDPIIMSRIPPDSISSAEALEEFVLRTFLDDFEERAKKDILHANKVVWQGLLMGMIASLLLILFIALICYLVFSFGPFWLQMLVLGTFLVFLACLWCYEQCSDCDNNDD